MISSIELGDLFGSIELSAKFYRVWIFEVWRVSLLLLIVYRVRIRVATFLRVTLPKFLKTYRVRVLLDLSSLEFHLDYRVWYITLTYRV